MEDKTITALEQDRIIALEDVIRTYRRMLREGTLSREADAYLRRIIEAEDELAVLRAKSFMNGI